MLTEIAISSQLVWWYGEMDTFFILAFLLLALHGLKMWDEFYQGRDQ